MECCGGDCHPVGCDDGNDCTDDSCNRTTGCQNIPRARGCDDGDPCTVGDRCVLAGGAVSCVPTGPRACLPPDQCHAGICHSDTGDCELVPLSGVPCVDANACTSGDTCVSGACTPGIPVVCFASNPCVDTSCDPFRGCQLVPKPDGTVCEGPDTVIGVCIAGACGTNPCPLGGVECDGDSATVCECPTLCAISSMGGFCVDPRDCRAAGCGFGEDCCADGPSAGSCYGSGCMACCPAAT